MELRHLRYFVAVAEELHFGRAALRLSIAQPPLSQQIRHLEEMLGTPLLRRTKRSVELTPAGRIFLDEARAILSQAERAALLAQRAARGEVGHFAVGFVAWADYTAFPSMIRMFGDRYPAVELELHCLPSRDQMAAVHNGRLQVGVVIPPIDDFLAAEPLFSETLVVAFPEGHRFASCEEVPWQEVATESYVAYSGECSPTFNAVIAQACREIGVALHVRHEADHPQTILALIEAGFGVSLLPASAARSMRPGVACRPLHPAGPPLPTVIVSERNDASPLVKSFLDVVHEVRAGRPAA